MYTRNRRIKFWNAIFVGLRLACSTHFFFIAGSDLKTFTKFVSSQLSINVLILLYSNVIWVETRCLGKIFCYFHMLYGIFWKVYDHKSLKYSRFTPKRIQYRCKSNISKKWKIGHPYVKCLKSTSHDFFGDLTHWWKNSVSHYSWTNRSI